MPSSETGDLVYGVRGDRGTGKNLGCPGVWEGGGRQHCLQGQLETGRQRLWWETYPSSTPRVTLVRPYPLRAT